MKPNRTCSLLKQYLSYLLIIKERLDNTIKEYRTDILFFSSIDIGINSFISFYFYCKYFFNLIIAAKNAVVYRLLAISKNYRNWNCTSVCFTVIFPI